MGARTGIEWTDATWSPLRVRVRKDAGEIAKAKGYTSLIQIAEKMAGAPGQHCEHVSEGYKHCYSCTWQKRGFKVNGTRLPFDRRSRDLVEAEVHEEALVQPLKWRTPKKIFVENQSDLFGDWHTDEMIDRVFAVMALCRRHSFQILTKRPDRMARWFSARSGCWILQHMERVYDNAHREPVWIEPNWPLPNVWLGVSIEDQPTADARIRSLLVTAASKRFISYEPCLAPVNLRPYLFGLDWVIAGGESGPGARPPHPDWFRSIRDQCISAGVPFFFKQWGEYQIGSDYSKRKVRHEIVLNDGRHCDEFHLDKFHKENPDTTDGLGKWPSFRPCVMARVGKKAAGALLDGREWREFPEAHG